MLHSTIPYNKSYTSLNEITDIIASPINMNMNINNMNINMNMNGHSHSHSHSHNLSRQSSVASLTGLDMQMSHQPDEGMSMAGPIATLMDVLKGGNVRTGALLNLIVLSLLLFATISDLASRTSTITQQYYYSEEQQSGEGIGIYPTSSSTRTTTTNDGHGLKSSTGHGHRHSHSKISSQKTSKNKKGLLGSAMIQSVTEALSPILPFAGGVDLRRDENWKSWNSWLALWDNKKDYSTTDRSRSYTYTQHSESTVDPVTLIPRGGGQRHKNKQNGKSNAGRRGQRLFQTKPTLSTADPFLPIDDISKMTLQEIGYLFKYMLQSTAENMDPTTFLKQHLLGQQTDNSRIEKAIHAVEKATMQSRGKGVSSAITYHSQSESNKNKHALSEVNGYGDIDALGFCAAMRILAEWRVLRQVPPGFKGYAVGMNLGHKDVVQNIVKIESSVHAWIEERSELEAEKRAEAILQPRSPTLRELLQYEIDIDVHPTSKLPRLKDKTAAMGLLWVRRQLQYQTSVFNNIISVPKVYPTIIDAVGSAYAEVYGQLHGWTVQKIFNYSFQSAPDADLVFRYMNPRKLDQVVASAKNGNVGNGNEDLKDHIDFTLTAEEYDPISSMNESLNVQAATVSEERIMLEKHENIDNPFINFFSNVGSEWDKLGKHVGSEVDKIGHKVGGEWDKVVCNLSNVFNSENRNECEIKMQMNTRRGSGEGAASASRNTSVKKEKQIQMEMSGEQLESYISTEMAADARQHILEYLNVAVPLLHDLAGLFDEMNMDDPTKV
jgi:hypothetical protein